MEMTIKVIEQTTRERNEETKALFDAIRPLLDEGYSYMTACVKIGHVDEVASHGQYGNGWFKDLKKYGATQGYDYKDYKGKRRK